MSMTNLRRLLLGATIAAFAIAAPVASAHGVGARLSFAKPVTGSGRPSSGGPPTVARLTFNHPQHTFTLRHARALDQRYEHSQGWAIQGTTCSWVRLHVAGCTSSLTVVVVDGQPAEQYTLVDYVTRSGACENAGPIVKRVGGVTYQKGGHHYGNCFTGPLVVLPHAIY